MENKIFSKFNIYDQIGYLTVGGIGLLLLSFDLWLLNKSDILPQLNPQNFIAWFIVAYLVGHIIQAIANIVIRENKTEFTDAEKELLNKAKEYFGLEKQSLNEIYLLCYMLSSAKDITGQVQSFNAYYSLYRGWFIAFAIESLFLLILVGFIDYNVWLLAALLFSMLIAFLFIKRARRFYKYSRGKTLQTFTIIQKLSL